MQKFSPQIYAHQHHPKDFLHNTLQKQKTHCCIVEDDKAIERGMKRFPLHE